MNLTCPPIPQSLIDLYNSRPIPGAINSERNHPEHGIKLSEALNLWLPGYRDGEVSYKIEARRMGKTSEGGGLLLETYCPQRVAERAMRLMPGYPEELLHLRKGEDLPAEQTYTVAVWRHENGEAHLMARYGTREDVQEILRGMIDFKLKESKRLLKMNTQLLAYHEYLALRQGKWLGADKAPTTAPRTDEPGLPFMADLQPEQQQGLAYCAVTAECEMSAAFPTGTGLALKQIHHARGLVDGGVYILEVKFGSGHPCCWLGRYDQAAKSRGILPLRFDDRGADSKPETFSLEWSYPGLKLFRVVAYTTRAEQLAPAMVAHTTEQLAAPALRGRSRRALAQVA